MSGATTSIASNGIVVEVLTRENYSTWKTLVKNYLMGNDLWYGVIREESEEDEDEEQHAKEPEIETSQEHDPKTTQEPEIKTTKEEETKIQKEKEIKNRKALHAIQLSCGKTLGKIKQFRKAKEAWDYLKTSFSEDVTAQSRMQIRNVDESTSLLQTSVKKGFLEDAKMRIDVSRDDIFLASPYDGRTVLHVAVFMRRMDIVKKLVMVGKKRLLKMQDHKGHTALVLAAKLTDDEDIAKFIVENGGEDLLTMTSQSEKDDQFDEIPVLLASAKGHKKMTRYLFSKTSLSFLRQDDWKYGVVLLTRCITNQIFDVAAAILRHDDERKLPLYHRKKELRPIYVLAHVPSAFPSTGTKLNWWQQFVYNNILSVKDLNNEKIEILVQETNQIGRPTIMTHTLPGLGRLSGQLQQFVQTKLIKFNVFKKIHEKKMDHYYVLEILDRLCKRVSILPEDELRETSAYDAMLQAAKSGITEFIASMRDANPELLLARDESNRGIFAHAIVNRQEEVFQLIHDEKNEDIFTSGQDTLGNTLLHIAAELGPSWYLHRISNETLQMQRELQWFQEVKKIVPKWCHGAKDPNGKKASEVFTDEHKELLKNSRQWAKETASSFIVVGTVIITVMFAACFTVPGGNNSNNGVPVFLGKNSFTIFIISVAISLVTSSSSVLMFIGILTSRYNEEDFIINLPLKLFIGLVTLFFAVASMMCAFGAALALMLRGYRLIVTGMWLALLPILVFDFSLLRLAAEIFYSTMSLRYVKPAAKGRKNHED